jgi:hypothetical protein
MGFGNKSIRPWPGGYRRLAGDYEHTGSSSEAMTNLASMRRLLKFVACGVEILCSPLIVDSRAYCCQDCLEGRPCDCAERMQLDERRSTEGGEPTFGLIGEAV